jgi:hypothetical protein
MNSFVDLVQVYATSSGPGPFALGAAVPGFDGVGALIDGASYSYSVQQGNNYEVGVGTYVLSTGTLTRLVLKSSNGGSPVAFDVNAQVSFTFTAEDIAALVSAGSTTAATAKAAFNAYGLQWGVWFNATPGTEELLALYTSPVAFQYPANFAGARSGAPLVAPAATFVLTMEQQAVGTGGWTAVGTVTIGTDGGVTLATPGGSVVSVGVGDRLRVVGPSVADTAIRGFAITFKGLIP